MDNQTKDFNKRKTGFLIQSVEIKKQELSYPD